MSTRYSDWIRAHEAESGYGWVKYRLTSIGTTKNWRFWELEKFHKFVSEHDDDIMWAMTFSSTDGAYYYNNGEWRRSSGARVAFSRDKAAGKVQGKSKGA